MAPRRLREPGADGKPSAEAVGVAFANLVGITGDDATALAALRKLPAADVVRGLNMMSMGAQSSTYPGPMIDGQVVDRRAGDGHPRGRPREGAVLIGANDREFGFMPLPPAAVDGMLGRFGADKDAVLVAYDPKGTGNKGEVGVGIMSDGAMVEPARLVARLASAAGQPTYLYRFSYVASSLRGRRPRARSTRPRSRSSSRRCARSTATRRRRRTRRSPPPPTRTGSPSRRRATRTRPACRRGRAYTEKDDVVMELGAAGPSAKADPWKVRLDLIEKAAGTATR